jgi:hypothetical protein
MPFKSSHGGRCAADTACAARTNTATIGRAARAAGAVSLPQAAPWLPFNEQ